MRGRVTKKDKMITLSLLVKVGNSHKNNLETEESIHLPVANVDVKDMLVNTRVFFRKRERQPGTENSVE